MMRRLGKTLVYILGITVLSVDGKAEASKPSAMPYDTIAERNVFDLQQQRRDPPEPPPPPIAKIRLTGITTILGDKRALLKVEIPAKPGEPAKEQFLILTEGQGSGQIEILQIDEKANTVRLKNAGTILLLAFERNSPKS
jgi:hypothetical protein